MRLTNQFSVMGRKYDLAYGQANTWKRKLENDKYELIENAIDKLGQLEDIEDELGVDLITLFKALKNGLFVKNKDNKVVEVKGYDRFDLAFDENDEEWVFFMSREFREENNLIHHYYYPKDYGKTWALTKEELEDEKEN